MKTSWYLVVPKDSTQLDQSIDIDASAWWSFASPELLDAAAAMFPVAGYKNTRGSWSSLWAKGRGGHARHEGRFIPGPYIERGVVRRPGAWPSVVAGPGVVKYRRVDADRGEVRSERETRDRLRGAFGQAEASTAGVKTAVTSWSLKSQNGLRVKIGSLDLGEFLKSGTPVFITLTLPGPWELVTPDAAEAFKLFRRWERKFVKRFGRLRCIWKREFQRRGAPHWHLWAVVPSGVDELELRDFVTQSWSDSMRVDGVPLSVARPGDYALSLAAGVQVDFMTAAASGTVQRLTQYFLKESVASRNKNYQNKPPALWKGQSVGRFWGVRGISVRCVEVELDPRYSVRVWRAIRKWREAQGRTVVREVQRVDSATGVARTRRVRRRVTQRGRSGFVLVPDGAVFAEQLARYVWQLDLETRPPSG